MDYIAKTMCKHDFSHQNRYNRMFHQVVLHKGGESEINYIKIFKNAKAVEI